VETCLDDPLNSVSRSLNVAVNKDVLEDVNVEKLIFLVQVAIQFSK